MIKDGKAFEEYNAEECKLLIESDALLDAAIERIKAYHPAFVIVCGDMTKDGEIICHEYIADLFAKLEKETGTKILVIPGNHDMNNPHSFYYDGDETKPAASASEARFTQIYANCGYDEAVEHREASLDYMAYPAESIAFIGVNSNEPNTADELKVQGGLSREQVEWITEMAGMAHAEGRYAIMAMHHNLVDFYDNAQLIRGSNIANARYDYDNASLINDLCSAGIDIVFSGHSHMQSITSATCGLHTIFSLIIAGALGNIIDCLFYGLAFSESTPLALASLFPEGGGYAPFFYGRVVDMIYVKLFPIPESFPLWGGSYFFPAIFNIADSCITVGVFMVLIFNKRCFQYFEKNEENCSNVDENASKEC